MLKKIFTAPEGSEPTAEIVEEAIKFNETSLVSDYDWLEDYYLGQHDILDRKRPNSSINNKIVVNHCKYITDVNVGYLLGYPVKYQIKGENDKDISKVLEMYEMQTISDEDHEVAKDVSIFGRQYEYTFVTNGNRLKSVEVDNRHCIIVYDDTFEHNKLFAVLYNRTGKDKYSAVKVLTATEEIDYLDALGKITEVSREPHKLDVVPVLEARNNDEYMGDFQQVIPLIDALNKLQSDRLNDKEQLVDAIMLIINMDLTKEQRNELKVFRTLSNVPLDAKVEFLTKELNETQLDIFRKNLVEDIHKISMTPNMSDENFAGNASGVAIKYKLLQFEQSIKNKERSFEKFLLERFQIYNRYLHKLKNIPLVEPHEVDVVFNRNLPQNDYETSQMISNLYRIGVPIETLIGQLSFVDNPKREYEKYIKELAKSMTVEAPNYGTEEPNEEEEQEEESEE